MDERLRSGMVFHGAIVILIGLVAGLPYAMVVTGSMPGEARAWSMAHLEGLLNGVLVLATAAAGGRLVLGAGQQKALAWSMVGMAYGNVVASIIGASFGVRGLTPAGPFANVVVYVMFTAAMAAVFVGVALLAWGARSGARAAATS